MYKSHNVLTEIGLFIKRHIVICLLSFISLLVILKNSHIPAPSGLPTPIMELMLCPPENTPDAEWWEFLSNICIAFISSIIAYIFIQYIPERRKANKAFTILKEDLCSLYSYMSYLISMYLFEIGVEKSEDLISEDDLSQMCNVELYDKAHYCRIRHMRNGTSENTTGFSYNLYADSKKYVDLMNKTVGQIKETICSAYLDQDIIDIVSQIDNNWFLQYFSYLKDSYVKTPGYKSVIISFDNGFYEFVKCHRSLGKYDFDLITYEFSNMSDEEIKSEKEIQLFLAPRSIYNYFGVSRAVSIADEITELQATEERLRKSEGVMLEMIVFYDFNTPKQIIILEAALSIAEYIFENETDDINKVVAYLNIMQIKKRLGTLSSEELEQLHCIADTKYLQNYIIVGALILIDNYEKATEYFEKLTDNERLLFVQFPIYRLWPDPPIEANPDPMLFLYCHDKNK